MTTPMCALLQVNTSLCVHKCIRQTDWHTNQRLKQLPQNKLTAAVVATATNNTSTRFHVQVVAVDTTTIKS